MSTAFILYVLYIFEYILHSLFLFTSLAHSSVVFFSTFCCLLSAVGSFLLMSLQSAGKLKVSFRHKKQIPMGIHQVLPLCLPLSACCICVLWPLWLCVINMQHAMMWLRLRLMLMLWHVVVVATCRGITSRALSKQNAKCISIKLDQIMMIRHRQRQSHWPRLSPSWW